MHLCILQHVSFETPGKIIDWSKKNSHTYTTVNLYQSESYPEQAEFDWLIIMGGPMGIYDEQQYPWLQREKTFIQNTIQNDKKIIGICLGAQLLAHCLGANIYPNKAKEIGWFPITVCNQNAHSLFGDCKKINPLHWHGDTFDLPKNSLHIAESVACKNQAFLYQNRILGLQFHLELSTKNVSTLIANSAAELTESGQYIQTQEEILNNFSRFDSAHTILYSLLDEFAAL